MHLASHSLVLVHFEEAEVLNQHFDGGDQIGRHLLEFVASAFFMEIIVLIFREFQIAILEHIFQRFRQLPLPPFRLGQQIEKHD